MTAPHPPRKGSFRLLIAGFGTLLLLMMAFITLSIVTLQQHQAQLDQVVGERMTKVSLALSLRKAARERTLSLLRLSLLEDAFEWEDEWLAFSHQAEKFIKARTALLDGPLTASERQKLDEQGRLSSKATAIQRQVLGLIRDDQRDRAIQLLANQAIPAQNAVIAKVDEFDNIQRQAADAARRHASENLNQAHILLLVLGGGAVLIGLAIAGLVIRTVRQRGARDAYLATHDPLTGLPNRTLLMDRLHQAISRGERQQGLVGLLFIDLDRFKHINDSYGHAAGDRVLITVAERITRQLRKSDTLGRLSGDEFVALLEEVPNIESAELTAQRIVDSCAEPIPLADQRIPIGVSIGIALYPEHGRTEDELLSHGDNAMYRSKQHGRNRWQTYEACTDQ